METVPTSNVIERTFAIRYPRPQSEGGFRLGSAFALDVDQRQYLVTAKHLIKELAARGELDILIKGSWVTKEVVLIGHSKLFDISVVVVEERLTPSSLPIVPSSQDLIYGQEVFFLGVPFGWAGEPLATGFHLPFVKRATVSLLHGHIFYLDGHNNRGFSGGPVVFKHPRDPRCRRSAIMGHI